MPQRSAADAGGRAGLDPEARPGGRTAGQRKVPCLTGICLLLCCLGAWGQQTVVDVEIRGLGPDDPQPGTLATFPGGRYDPRSIDADLRLLRASGFYHDSISVSLRQTPQGPVVIFSLQPRLRLQEAAQVIGLELFDPDHLYEGLAAGDPLDPARVAAAAESLRVQLTRRGRWWCTVEPRIDTSDDKARVELRVSEGPEVELGEMHFAGNSALTTDQLREVLAAYELTSFRRSTYEQLAQVLQLHYMDQGYLRAEVWLQQIEEEWARGLLHLHFGIDEGPRFLLRHLELPPDAPETDIPLNAPISLPALRELRARLAVAYEDRGQFQARLHESVQFVGEREVDVRIEAEPGPRLRVGRIELFGNHKSRDSLVLDKLALKPGSYPTPGWRAVSLRRLQRPDLFDQVRIQMQPGGAPGHQDFRVDLKEAWTRGVRFAGSFNEVAGPLGDVFLEESNFDITRLPTSLADFIAGRGFAGGGQRLSLSWGLGKDRMRGRIRYIYPGLGAPELDLYLVARAETQRLEAHREILFAFEPELRQWLGDSMWLGWGLRIAQLSVDQIDNLDAFQILVDSGNHQVASAQLRWVWDRRKQFPLGWTGSYFEAVAKLQTGLNGGDSDLLQGDVRAEWGSALPGFLSDFGLELKLAAGFIEPLAGERVTIFDRYYLGGRRLLRGFRYRGAGPREAGEPIGGRARATGSLDLTFPLFWERLRGSLFLGGGLLAESWEEAEYEDARLAAGAGLRFLVPEFDFPVLFDFAFPIIRDNQDDSEIFSFSFQVIY